MDQIIVKMELDSGCLPIVLQWVNPGQFTMSNSFLVNPKAEDDAVGTFEVMISYGYWMATYPITLCQWQLLMYKNPLSDTHLSVGSNHPVTNITWHEAIDFCQRLNSKPLPKPEGYSFGLPTEAQWEYACRANTKYQYQIGNNTKDLSQVAWHRNNASGPKPVAQKAPNLWGFYDMLGNISEMCLDGTTFYPDNTTQTDWVGDMPLEGPWRTKRGGNVVIDPIEAINCSTRSEFETTDKDLLTGFRICLKK